MGVPTSWDRSLRRAAHAFAPDPIRREPWLKFRLMKNAWS